VNQLQEVQSHFLNSNHTKHLLEKKKSGNYFGEGSVMCLNWTISTTPLYSLSRLLTANSFKF